MPKVARQALLLLALLSPSACASRTGWEAGMMGGMMIGGLIVGRGMMHGMHDHGGWTSEDVACYQPDSLLDRREALALTETQVVALGAVLQDREEGRRTWDDAARAATALLTPEQRSAARPASQMGHHTGGADD